MRHGSKRLGRIPRHWATYWDLSRRGHRREPPSRAAEDISPSDEPRTAWSDEHPTKSPSLRRGRTRAKTRHGLPSLLPRDSSPWRVTIWLRSHATEAVGSIRDWG